MNYINNRSFYCLVLIVACWAAAKALRNVANDGDEERLLAAGAMTLSPNFAQLRT